MIILTNRQKEVLNFIVLFIRDNGMPPTIREIADALGINSTNAANDHLVALEKKGYIERVPMTSRGIKLLPSAFAETGNEPCWRDSIDDKGKPTIRPSHSSQGCHHCDGPLDAKSGIGQYECPWCVAMFGGGVAR